MARIRSLESARAAAREIADQLLEEHRAGLERAVSPREVRAILGSSFDVRRRAFNKTVTRKMREHGLFEEAVRDVIGGFVERRLATDWEAENREAVRDASAYREAPPVRAELLRPPRHQAAVPPVAMAPPDARPIIAIDDGRTEHTATRVVGAAFLAAGVGAMALMSDGFRNVSQFSVVFGGSLALCGLMMLFFPKHVDR